MIIMNQEYLFIILESYLKASLVLSALPLSSMYSNLGVGL